MRRQDKYPDTSTFHYFNANPKNRKTGDCVYRALTAATGRKWEEIVFGCAALAVKHGFSPASKETYGRLLEMLGFEKQRQPRKPDGTKYTGKQFCEALQRYIGSDSLTAYGGVGDEGFVVGKRIVANIGGNHTVAIIDGKVWDIWNSTDGCIGNYWVKGA